MNWSAILKRMVKGRQLAATIVVLLAMATMIRLGFWQLDRLEQRRAANAVLAASITAGQVDLNAARPDDPAAVENRTIVARGDYDLEQQVVLLVQNWAGSAGVHLITPLLLEGGETAVLVDRGWVPDAVYQSGDFSQFDITGPTTVTGYGALSQTLSRYGDPSAVPEGPQTEIYRVDIAQIGAQLPYPLLPFYIREAPVNDNEELPYRAAREVDLSEGNHLSYAVQWFAFTLILGVIYVGVVQRSINKVQNEEVDVDA